MHASRLAQVTETTTEKARSETKGQAVWYLCRSTRLFATVPNPVEARAVHVVLWQGTAARANRRSEIGSISSLR